MLLCHEGEPHRKAAHGGEGQRAEILGDVLEASEAHLRSGEAK